MPSGSIAILVVLSLGSWKIIMGFRQAVRHETLTLTFASSILATPAMYVYRNGYNGADLKSAVSALIRHGRSNRPTYVIMQITMDWFHAALIRLVAEFDSQICDYSPIRRNSYERNVLTETNYKTRNPETTGCRYLTKYPSWIYRRRRL